MLEPNLRNLKKKNVAYLSSLKDPTSENNYHHYAYTLMQKHMKNRMMLVTTTP